MKSIFSVCAFFIVICQISKAEDSSSLILGGRNATIAEFPYMVGILTNGRFTCGGAIINSRSVLTAAHCYVAERVSAVSIFVGSSRQNGESGRIYRILRFILHPEYKYIEEPFYLQTDVAVIKTILPIRFNALVQPIPLQTNNVRSRSRVELSGWGLLAITPDVINADQLQAINLVTISNLRCSWSMPNRLTRRLITSEKICVQSRGNRGPCSGDSGSPLVSNGKVVAVVSWGPECGVYPGVFIRVSSHYEWINRQL